MKPTGWEPGRACKLSAPEPSDEKFGRVEGQGLDRALNGWARQDLPHDELLRRGMDLIEGLYESLV